MFDSKHEKDIKEQLKNINNNIENVMSEIKIMGKQIISSLGDLNSSLDELIYSTQESNERIVEGLESVNSSIDVNNLISSIQTYQLYKINKNTRGLRE
jgi:methyl-accepting chemotaxis protein